MARSNFPQETIRFDDNKLVYTPTEHIKIVISIAPMLAKMVQPTPYPQDTMLLNVHGPRLCCRACSYSINGPRVKAKGSQVIN